MMMEFMRNEYEFWYDVAVVMFEDVDMESAKEIASMARFYESEFERVRPFNSVDDCCIGNILRVLESNALKGDEKSLALYTTIKSNIHIKNRLAMDKAKAQHKHFSRYTIHYMCVDSEVEYVSERTYNATSRFTAVKYLREDVEDEGYRIKVVLIEESLF